MQLKDKGESLKEHKAKAVSGDEYKFVSGDESSKASYVCNSNRGKMDNTDEFGSLSDEQKDLYENAETDMDGFNLIQKFLADQSLNDYYNAAVDAAENVHPKNSEAFDEQNQENIDPNSR